VTKHWHSRNAGRMVESECSKTVCRGSDPMSTGFPK
jgi:hypothetical protein